MTLPLRPTPYEYHQSRQRTQATTPFREFTVIFDFPADWDDHYAYNWIVRACASAGQSGNTSFDAVPFSQIQQRVLSYLKEKGYTLPPHSASAIIEMVRESLGRIEHADREPSETEVENAMVAYAEATNHSATVSREGIRAVLKRQRSV